MGVPERKKDQISVIHIIADLNYNEIDWWRGQGCDEPDWKLSKNHELILKMLHCGTFVLRWGIEL